MGTHAYNRSLLVDCGPPATMPLATMSVKPDLGEITASTAYPLFSTATYTCQTGAEYQDGEVEKVSECSVGGEWKPDLVTEDFCERESSIK